MIGPDDVVSVSGRYLVKPDGSRFVMKGIGFPVPEPSSPADSATRDGEPTFNATAWNGVLRQLVLDLDVEINTVRVYRMDPSVDYTPFFSEAARLGVYVIVPLTGASGAGVLDRNKDAPKCYSRRLYRYGIKCLENYGRYPNVLAGLVGNEVMNSLETWGSASCVKAFARDLKLYMAARTENSSGTSNRALPLMYAAQNSGVGPSLDDVSTMRLTMDYLTCVPGSMQLSNQGVLARAAASISAGRDESSSDATLDIFGINVESWCSSNATFERNEDGSEGSYHSLWTGLQNSTIPLVFSEMGCSHMHFDRDNGLQQKGGPRDWGQVSVVLNQMGDVFSGFCAYAYCGNPQFDMFEGGPWRDEPLEPTDDLYNFRDQLKMASKAAGEKAEKADNSSESPVALLADTSPQRQLPLCASVEAELNARLNIELYDVDGMRTYSAGVYPMLFWVFAAATMFGALISAYALMRRRQRKMEQRTSEEGEWKLLETQTSDESEEKLMLETQEITYYQSIGTQ